MIRHDAGHICQDISIANTLCGGTVALSQPATGDTQLSRQSGQTRDGACRLPAMLMFKYGTTTQHNYSRSLHRIASRQAADALRLNAGNCGCPFWCVLLHMRGKLRKAERVVVDEFLVMQPFFQDHVRHSQRERCITARWNQQHFVGVSRRLGAASVDVNNISAAFACLDEMRGEIGLTCQVRPPQQNGARVGRHILFRVGLQCSRQSQSIAAHSPAHNRGRPVLKTTQQAKASRQAIPRWSCRAYAMPAPESHALRLCLLDRINHHGVRFIPRAWLPPVLSPFTCAA